MKQNAQYVFSTGLWFVLFSFLENVFKKTLLQGVCFFSVTQHFKICQGL